MDKAFHLQDAATEVGLAVRRPEQLVLRWQDATGKAATLMMVVLLVNAAFGTAVYGVTMHMHHGAWSMLKAAVFAPLAAGGAWIIALPALYIFNSSCGSRISLQTTLLAASITVCFGAWAMLASVPINWFFSLALPNSMVRLLINLVIFTGVGICMTDVFIRILQTIEPERSSVYGYIWVGLLAVIGAELFSLTGIFEF